MLKLLPLTAAALATTLLCALAGAKKPSKPHTTVAIGGGIEAAGGVLHGRGTLREDAIYAEVGAELEPQLKFGRKWQLGFPADVRYRHTWLTALRELEAGLSPNLSYHPVRQWEFELETGVDGDYRPGWPDQYQVQADGSLADTDRFSMWRLFGGGSVRWGSFKKTRLKLSYQLARVDYLDDPAYDPNEEPTHLVPGDRLEHSVNLDGHRRWGSVSVKPGLDVKYKHYFNTYARDAGTGLTHAGAGGLPPNPILRLWDLEPGVRVEIVALEDGLTLTPGYVHEINVDIYEGYYSYQGPHVSFDAEAHPAADWRIDLGLDWRLHRYGSGSYAESPAGTPAPPPHPPLESGSRREESQLDVDLKVAYAVAAHWSLLARAGWTRKSSNLPDYVPGVYPSSRQYSIDWDTTNAEASLGAAYEF